MAAAGSTLIMESTIVRDTMPRWAGDYGRGVLVFFDIETLLRAEASLWGSLISGNVEAGVFAQGTDLTIDRTTIRDTWPAADGHAGRGVNMQSDDAGFAPANLLMIDSLVDGNHDVGVFAEGTIATVTRTTIKGTRPRLVDGLFGDGIHLETLFLGLPSEFAIDSCQVDGNQRAGIATLGGTVTLASTSLVCNPIALNGQDGAAPFSYSDLGGNERGCDGNSETCKLSSTDLAPPEPMPQ